MADYKSTHTGAEIDAGIDKATTAESNWSLLMANLGNGRWANQSLINEWGSGKLIDNLSLHYTSAFRYLAHTTYIRGYDGATLTKITLPKFRTDFYSGLAFNEFFAWGCELNLILDDFQLGQNTFNHYLGTSITALDDANVITNGYIGYCIANCPNLITVEGVNFINSRGATNLTGLFSNCPKLKTIKCKNIVGSINISKTSVTTEEDMQNVINSLSTAVVSNTILTINSTQNSAMTDTQRTYLIDTLGWTIAVA